MGNSEMLSLSSSSQGVIPELSEQNEDSDSNDLGKCIKSHILKCETKQHETNRVVRHPALLTCNYQDLSTVYGIIGNITYGWPSKKTSEFELFKCLYVLYVMII